MNHQTNRLVACIVVAINLFACAGALAIEESPASDPAAASDHSDPKKPAAGGDIADKLDRSLPEITFDGVGLADVIDFLCDVSSGNIEVNWRALEAAGIDRNCPVSAHLRNVKFSKVLRVILDSAAGGQDDMALDFVVDANVLTISTRAALKTKTQTQTYDVAFLVSGPKDAKPDAEVLKRRGAALVKAILVSIDPHSWRANGGSIGNIALADGKLTVKASKENQDAIAALLEQLRELTK